MSAKSSQSWTPPDATAYASAKTSSDLKTLLKILPFVIFGVPLVLALKDRMFGPEVKPGGDTDTFQLLVLVGCTAGLIGTAIVLFLTRKK